jgi:nicotinamide-nucleotide amidase
MVLRIDELVVAVANKFTQEKLRLAVVESCTGGGLSYWITSVPGSSTWFERGFVTYSKEAKMKMVDVKAETIKTFGEVSEQTVIEMAEGGLKHSLADICIAITGIAGPDGGTPEKPVGTVWIAWANHKQPSTIATHYVFSGERQRVRLQAIEAALQGLL